jgi:hypothetical protein
VAGESHNPMIEIHTLSQFDHFTLMKQIQQEEDAQ